MVGPGNDVDVVQVFVMAANGSSQCAASYADRPTYPQLSQMLKDARTAGLEIFQVHIISWCSTVSLSPQQPSKCRTLSNHQVCLIWELNKCTRCLPDGLQVASKASNMFGDRNEPSISSSGDNSAPDASRNPLSDSEIDLMDAVMLRKYLAAYGAPASGKISKLRERLKEAIAEAAS